MRLRTFRAANMTEAMGLVRAELGGEALILANRRVAGGIEVTAGLDDADAPPPLDRTAPGRTADRGAGDPVAGDPGAGDPDRALALAWHGAPQAVAARLRAGPLAFALSAALRFAPLPLAPADRPLLLSGPPGAGKSLTAARLATRLVLAGTAPLVITADGRRAGAAEQLAAFTRVLGLELLAAGQPATLARAVARREPGLPVLIDSPGVDPFDRAELAAMRALADAAGADLVAVLPAGGDAAETGDMAEAYAECGARLLVATRLDLARRLGGVLAAGGAGLALAEFGIGPGAADGLAPATPGLLATRLGSGWLAGTPRSGRHAGAPRREASP